MINNFINWFKGLFKCKHKSISYYKGYGYRCDKCFKTKLSCREVVK